MMIKEKFVEICDLLEKQREFSNKFDEALEMINSSFTVCELSPFLDKAFKIVFKEAFNDKKEYIYDFVFDYMYEKDNENKWQFDYKLKDETEFKTYYITNWIEVYDFIIAYMIEDE